MKMKKTRAFLGFYLLAALVLLFSITASADETTFSVRYGEMKDGSFVNSYSKWNTRAQDKETIRTVSMKDKGGKRCWWRIRGNGGSTGLVRSGESFTVTGNVRLTPVWRKIYTIRFYNKKGTKEYKSKKLTILI